MATIIDGGGGSGGMIVGVVAGALAVVVVVLFLTGNLNFGGSRTVDVDVPAVTVQTTPDGQ